MSVRKKKWPQTELLHVSMHAEGRNRSKRATFLLRWKLLSLFQPEKSFLRHSFLFWLAGLRRQNKQDKLLSYIMHQIMKNLNFFFVLENKLTLKLVSLTTVIFYYYFFVFTLPKKHTLSYGIVVHIGNVKYNRTASNFSS